MADDTVCKHIEEITAIKKAKEYVCEECIKTGDNWVHLRVCQTCGSTLCCDASPNKHMTKHNTHTNHPVITSAEPGEQWMYCYPDQLFVEYD
ncbi:MAG: UBP-type zinc finger domain-containing protein [Chitinophagaceae bacterium]